MERPGAIETMAKHKNNDGQRRKEKETSYEWSICNIALPFPIFTSSVMRQDACLVSGLDTTW